MFRNPRVPVVRIVTMQPDETFKESSVVTYRDLAAQLRSWIDGNGSSVVNGSTAELVELNKLSPKTSQEVVPLSSLADRSWSPKPLFPDLPSPSAAPSAPPVPVDPPSVQEPSSSSPPPQLPVPPPPLQSSAPSPLSAASPPPAVSTSRPPIKVTFEVEKLGAVETFYHDVQIGSEFLVLVYDRNGALLPRYRPPRWRPQDGQPPRLAVLVERPSMPSKLFLAHSLGLEFSYGPYEFVLLLVDEEYRGELHRDEGRVSDGKVRSHPQRQDAGRYGPGEDSFRFERREDEEAGRPSFDEDGRFGEKEPEGQSTEAFLDGILRGLTDSE